MIHVFKFGSAILREGAFSGEAIHMGRIRRWVEGVRRLHAHGDRVIWVTSGAIALGSRRLGQKPSSLAEKQAAAAVGQIDLMGAYQNLFSSCGLSVAQVLLTHEDFVSPARSFNIQGTIQTLLSQEIIPIINENDTTATEEITFGDNDRLSAMVATLVKAKTLVILSNVEGLYPRNADGSLASEPITLVKSIDETILNMASSEKSDVGTGGMSSKIKAAELACRSGIQTMIAHGDRVEVVDWLMKGGKSPGTLFLSQPTEGLKTNLNVESSSSRGTTELIRQFDELVQSQKVLAHLTNEQKQNVLAELAEALQDTRTRQSVLEVNAKEVSRERGRVSPAFLDRLLLTESRLNGMAKQILEIASFRDPLHPSLIGKTRHSQGFWIEKHRVPLGCIGMIYESRPNVLVDAFALCFKSSNAIFLRCGSESFETSKALLGVIHQILHRNGLPKACVQLPPSADRKYVLPILHADKHLDLLIPRGGESLISFVKANSSVPLVKHDKGVCHLYVDAEADVEMAIKILMNGKTQRPGVCNALESVLVHQSVAKSFLPKALKSLHEKRVEVRLESKLFSQWRTEFPDVVQAQESDWGTEYLDLILSIKQVNSLSEALHHLSEYGSKHSEVIVTSNRSNAETFLNEVDASAVFWNVSTRFNDGGEFGLGAEMGISTQKLHVRGPMGLEALTTYKYIIRGNGNVRG